MKYSKFSITNYKGIPKLTLDLTKKPNTNIFTLVGLNESGKTSILEALYLFHKDMEKNEVYNLIPKSQQYNFTGSISIQAELELEENDINLIKALLKDKHKFHLSAHDQIIRITKKYNFKKSIPLEDSWKETLWGTSFIGKTNQAKHPRNLHDWNRNVWNEVTTLIKERLLPKILYYPDFLFKFPEKIYLEQYPNEGREQEEYRKVVGDILQAIDRELTLEEDLLKKMKMRGEKSYKESLSQLLLKMSSKLNDTILKEWDAIFGGGQKKEVVISGESEKDTEGRENFFIELKIKQGSDSYSINERSLGFRWFFSFLIFTAFRKSRSSDPGETLFLLDEPASNLHQRSQQKLLESLDGIVSKCKLIYSTHSHHMINPKWLGGTYIVKNEAINYGNPEEAKTTETSIDAILYKNFVAKYPDEEDHFKPILDALQYIPSKLEVVPNTIFTEGKNDYYTFKYISEIILKNRYHLNFYPGAGVNKYRDVFRLYLAWLRNFLAIFDADRAGLEAKKDYINEIGADLTNRIFTLNELNKAWQDLQTEDLFSDLEKIKIIQTCFPEHNKEDGYNKSKFYTAIQQLYINNIKFSFNKTTLDKFIEIFKFIKAKFKQK